MLVSAAYRALVLSLQKRTKASEVQGRCHDEYGRARNHRCVWFVADGRICGPPDTQRSLIL